MRRTRLLLVVSVSLVAAAPAGQVVRALDLQEAFGTKAPWRLTVTQGADIPDPIMQDGGKVPGPITACLSPDGSTCLPELRDALRLSAGDDLYVEPHELLRAVVVRPRPHLPVLLIQLASLHGVNGNQRVATQLFRYDHAADGFRLAYQRQVGRNNNEEVRYIDAGSLAGAVVAAEPTGNAPFGFWMTIDRIGADGGYHPVLRYRSVTRYGDGNPLAVIDSDMPEIQRRLGLWRPGRPLPVPAPCPAPRLVRGALWCGPPPAR